LQKVKYICHIVKHANLIKNGKTSTSTTAAEIFTALF
jgi:hypothetical protein